MNSPLVSLLKNLSLTIPGEGNHKSIPYTVPAQKKREAPYRTACTVTLIFL